MNIMLYPDTMIPRLPQRFPLAFDVEDQPSPLTPADVRSPVNVRPCHYSMARNFSKRIGTSIMTTHQSILHKFDGLIPYSLTHLSTHSN